MHHLGLWKLLKNILGAPLVEVFMCTSLSDQYEKFNIVLPEYFVINTVPFGHFSKSWIKHIKYWYKTLKSKTQNEIRNVTEGEWAISCYTMDTLNNVRYFEHTYKSTRNTK